MSRFSKDLSRPCRSGIRARTSYGYSSFPASSAMTFTPSSSFPTGT